MKNKLCEKCEHSNYIISTANYYWCSKAEKYVDQNISCKRFMPKIDDLINLCIEQNEYIKNTRHVYGISSKGFFDDKRRCLICSTEESKKCLKICPLGLLLAKFDKLNIQKKG